MSHEDEQVVVDVVLLISGTGFLQDGFNSSGEMDKKLLADTQKVSACVWVSGIHSVEHAAISFHCVNFPLIVVITLFFNPLRGTYVR